MKSSEKGFITMEYIITDKHLISLGTKLFKAEIAIVTPSISLLLKVSPLIHMTHLLCKLKCSV